MSRLTSLFVQLAILIVAIGTVFVVRDGGWAADTILIWTAILAVALAAIISSQIGITLKNSARAKRARRRQPAPKKIVVNHTARLQRAIDPMRDAKRRRAREESRRLNIEAEIRLMQETANK